ncbi:MAG: HAD hydrolase-like protein, partial [Pseudomonadota bacterium]
ALFDVVMTSGEALWRDVAEGRVTEHALFPIERAEGDAAAWADGLDVTLTGTLAAADAVLLMGLPDGEGEGAYATLLGKARAARLPVICTNPDRASPRADGGIVVSPGALAHAYADLGGDVRFYGKPHLPVFRALEAALGATPAQILMVGDSLEHDVAGGHSAGWATAFVEGGLYAAEFAGTDPVGTLTRIAEASAAPMPDYSIARLQ